MTREVLRYLRCPLCAGPLAGTGPPAGGGPRTLGCARGHRFDISRQGYVNLLTGRSAHPGDTAAMVAARSQFLAAGHYQFICAALAEAARAAYPVDNGLVVDAGAGTGHQLAAVLDALPGALGLALDVAKPALRRAARVHPRAAAVACDTWRRLPLADRAAALVLNVFAPRNGAEFHRVLRPDGTLLVVTPTTTHLAELVGPLGLLTVDPAKPDRVAASLDQWFTSTGGQRLGRTMRLTQPQVRALVQMGPSAWHADAAGLDRRIAALPEPVAVTAAVHLGRYRPR